ncbi:MAG TPA: hypothetical protein VLH60_04040 [Sedimentisphaerales bacterium]|nr:hypothetical protein [Sedimentisphaerales bacterium]
MSRFITSVVLLTALMGLPGCAWTARGLKPPEKPGPAELMATFNETALRQSNAGDVLMAVRHHDLQMVTQGQHAVAVSGPVLPAQRTWLTLVTFDESLTASGKYFFLINDEPRAFLYTRTLRARFDIEKVITPEVLAANYPDEESRVIAVFRDLTNGFIASTREVRLADNRTRACAMAGGQLLGEILTGLTRTPVDAGRIASTAGVPFDHSTMGKGRYRMVIEGDVARLKIIVGSVREDFDRIPDAQTM